MQSRMMRCLFDMLHVPQSPGAVLWVDDRYISGYPEHQGNAFLGVTDVLRALRTADSLAEHAYFEALLRLRAGGAMFIPVDYEEVLYHLRAAPVINGTVQETPALATLRRYVARALLCDRHLKVLGVPAGLDGRPDEMEFLMGLLRLAENCIIKSVERSRCRGQGLPRLGVMDLGRTPRGMDAVGSGEPSWRPCRARGADTGISVCPTFGRRARDKCGQWHRRGPSTSGVLPLDAARGYRSAVGS